MSRVRYALVIATVAAVLLPVTAIATSKGDGSKGASNPRQAEGLRKLEHKRLQALVGAIGVGVVVPSATAQPTDEPGEPTCQAAVISHAVQVGTRSTSGRRAVAELFFGDYPKAVQDAERAVQEFCTSQ